MPHTIPTRQHAWELLNQYTKKPTLIKHALAVEATMRYFAERAGEEPDYRTSNSRKINIPIVYPNKP